MTIKLLTDGRIYHASINPDGSTREHFHDGAVREDPDCYVFDCVECDSISVVPKDESNSDFRHIREMREKGFARIKPAPKERSKWDTFAFAREDGMKNLPAKPPQSTTARIALREKIKAKRYG